MAVRLRRRLEASSAVRPTAGGGLATILLSAAVSLAALAPLGSSVRIRWAVGTHYGPEYAPAALVLVAFPIAVALAVVGARALATALERRDAFDGARPYYELAVLSVLLWLLVGQVVLVVANLL